MVKSPYQCIDTPALLLDRRRVRSNISWMQDKADRYGVKLRPHTKTHRMPKLAEWQARAGAAGITVAKVGEAEVMAAQGLDDIFIANEIVGESKLRRVRALHERLRIRIGVDNRTQIDQIEAVFAGADSPLEALVEIEVGEDRSGVIHEADLLDLARYTQTKRNVTLKGVFSHEGHTYKAPSVKECVKWARLSQERTLAMAAALQACGVSVDTVSIGATPSMQHAEIAAGITEIRPGTYIFMDVGQGGGIGDFSRCAATILTTVISKPTDERVVLDAGAKALTSQNRSAGICATYGYGLVKDSDNIRLSGVFDEHGLIYDREFCRQAAVGDKIEVIPNHICPACNLYEKAYLVEDGAVLEEIPVLGRGRSQ